MGSIGSTRTDAHVTSSIEDIVTPVKNPAIFNAVTSATPGAESSIALGMIKRFSVSNLGNVRVKMAFVSGQSGTLFKTLFPGSTYSEREIDDQVVTLYVQAASPSQRLEVVTWT